MDNWFKNKWFVRGLALFLAVLLYVFVGIEARSTQSDDRIIPSAIDMQTLQDVPVNIKIDRDRFVVSGVPEEVNVSLEGPKGILTRTVLQQNLEVFVDLKEYEEGKHIVDLNIEKVPDELTAYIDPKTIEIEIEERATDDFTVSIDYINKDLLPPGYEIGEATINPGKVSIMSSRSTLNQVAIVKAYIDVEGLTESIKNRETPVNVYDSLGNVLNVNIDPSSVVVSVDINNPSKEVAIEVVTTGELPEGLVLADAIPEKTKIEVFATSKNLAELTTLKTEEIDLSEITESGTIDVKLDLPEDVSVEQDTIQVDLQLEQKKEITDLSVDIINQANVDVLFDKPKKEDLSFFIEGEQEKISKLSQDDFNISIDVGGLDKGKHTVDLVIKGPSGVNINTEYETIGVVID